MKCGIVLRYTRSCDKVLHPVCIRIKRSLNTEDEDNFVQWSHCSVGGQTSRSYIKYHDHTSLIGRCQCIHISHRCSAVHIHDLTKTRSSWLCTLPLWWAVSIVCDLHVPSPCPSLQCCTPSCGIAHERVLYVDILMSLINYWSLPGTADYLY